MTAPSLLDETTRNQRKAATPGRSAFVMANAGSGKTRVLTNRVARLLLAGAAPEKILCITFTKAAAAEMAERLFNVLGAWALFDDDRLNAALAALEGPGAAPRGAAELANARRLFARALETPGGLKIQTIHSFCESALRRFPIEAGAPPGFTVLEDAEARRLADDALNDLARNALYNDSLGADLRRLGRARNERQLRDLLRGGAAARLEFETALRAHGGDVRGVCIALAEALGVDPETTAEAARRSFLAALPRHDLERCYEALYQSGGNPAKLAAHIQTFLDADATDDQWAALEKLFLTAAGKPRDKIATKATDKADPAARDRLDRMQGAFAEAAGAVRALDIFHDSAAYYRLTDAAITRYAAAKAARAALDFDDLIARALTLFQHTDNAWVMYKLDYGVDHILIDEAQDTSPAQWAVIEALFADYLSGAGARAEARSFFAVGDMKQSIYSFQGADVALFREKELDLGKRLGAVAPYDNVPLTLSFRTAAPVLRFVDETFNDRAAAEGLGDYPIPAHGVQREGEAGLVELWPLAPRPDTEKPNPWDAPVDAPAEDHPVKALSARIASVIGGWIDAGAVLESRGRAIAPGDVMILVQSRGALFEEVIRRLAAAGVPVAGADRLRLLEDPAVEDLLSYARTALYENDDLSLAEVLKSPLFGFDDDTDLFPLAHPRAPGQSLWSALRARAGENPRWARAGEEIAAARSTGRNEGPYSFFCHILESDGKRSGRKRFHGRLGEAARDGVDELLRQALHYENSRPRSLRSFLSWFEANAGDIKREMEQATDAVRVMTTHGAKGLEANIVFLIDAHRTPRQVSDGVLKLSASAGDDAPLRAPLSVLAGAAGRDTPLTEEARAEKKRRDYEEYRRLFYVAATRARDRLYICGVEDGRKGDARDKDVAVKSWHALAQDAFDRLADAVEEGRDAFWPSGGAPLRRLSSRQTAAAQTADQSAGQFAAGAAQEAPAAAPPPWLFEPAAPEAGPRRIVPSRLVGESDASPRREAGADGPDGDRDDAAAGEPVYPPTLARDRYFRGRTLHRLLELLPDIAPDARRAAADRLLGALAGDLPSGERAAWREEVMTVLAEPAFAAVFAPGSRAEVAVAGRPRGAPENVRISGQIDRLAVSAREVLIVDYKTNRPPPDDIRRANPAYIAQLAAYRALLQEIYPDHEIRCALLWTYAARLAEVPKDMLDHAFERML